MGFFQTFWTWLNAQLAGYIGDVTARVAVALEPAVITLATLYIMAWGYLQISGRIEEPFVSGLKRIMMVALVLVVCLKLWLYNSVIVDTFYRAPTQLAAAIIGADDPVNTIDSIWSRGGAVAGQLWQQAFAFSENAIGFMLAGTVVWLMVGMLCVYTMFLIALSSVALSVLLALGPLFVAMLLFDSTRRYFSGWIAQLANYGLITVLSVLTAALLLRIVQTYVTQTAARGAAIQTLDALDMVLMSVLVFLFMRQVMPIAAALAGGVSLNSFNLVSRVVGWGRAQVFR
jgi:type IV secretion system protein VirB6